MSSFLSLGVPKNLAAVLAASGKHEPFPIQRDTLPDSLAGHDVLGRGRTGSGKTIAFALPLVARLTGAPAARPSRPRGLVLAPTRELATQIAATIAPLADAAGLTVTTIFGGVSQRPQEQAMARGVDIVVACPGRLEDLMKQGIVRLDAVQLTVLDEADHMADMGFLPGVTRILAATPERGQRLLFSATLDNGVDVLVRRFLHEPVRHELDESGVPAGVMTHRVFVVAESGHKTALVQRLASGHGRRILFTRTKHQAKKLARQLTAAGIPAVDLQGNLSQAARERNLAAFGTDPAAGGVRVLVATDVAARGVHVDNVELVVHVDPPVEHKSYLHRSGRTARAGAEGVVVTVALHEQRREVADLLRKARIDAALERVEAHSPEVDSLVGAAAPHVTPAPAPEARPAAKPGSGSSGRRPSGGAAGGASRGGRGSRAGGGQGNGRGQGQGNSQGQSHGQSRGHGPAQGYGQGQGHAHGRSQSPTHAHPGQTTGSGQARPEGAGRARGPRRAGHPGGR